MDDIPANTAFTITMAINNLETGNFVNAQANYYAAPQQVNAQGDIIGHSHFVIEALQSITQTTPLDPTKFAFFQGVNTAASNGVLSVPVTAGLPAGSYRVASINAAANHQPVLVAVAQHGSLDDMSYFTVGGGGAGVDVATNNATASAAAAAAASSAATASKGGKGGNAAGAAAAAAATTTAAAAASTSAAAATGKGGAAAGAAKGGAAKGGAAAAGGKFGGFGKGRRSSLRL